MVAERTPSSGANAAVESVAMESIGEGGKTNGCAATPNPRDSSKKKMANGVGQKTQTKKSPARRMLRIVPTWKPEARKESSRAGS